MKKVLTAIFALLLVLFMYVPAYATSNVLEHIAVDGTRGTNTVYRTPNGSVITLNAHAYIAPTAQELQGYAEEALEYNATQKREATNCYNCHFYAWAGRKNPGLY